MSETICRLYATRDKAEKASEALRKLGYADIHLFARTGGADTVESLAEAIAAARVVPDEARHYAERVAQGNALVVVHTLFGGALRARMILDGEGPIDSGLPKPSTAVVAAAAASAAASGPGWFRAKHPFEALTGWSTLMKEGWMFSDRFGWRYLTSDPTPFSSAMGWRLLSDNPHPLSSRMGWKLLSDNPHPFSSMMGWKLLSDDKPQAPAAAAAPAQATPPAATAPAAEPQKKAKATESAPPAA